MLSSCATCRTWQVREWTHLYGIEGLVGSCRYVFTISQGDLLPRTSLRRPARASKPTIALLASRRRRARRGEMATWVKQAAALPAGSRSLNAATVRRSLDQGHSNVTKDAVPATALIEVSVFLPC